MNCPHCHASLDPQARFCGACGRKLDDAGGVTIGKGRQADSMMRTLVAGPGGSPLADEIATTQAAPPASAAPARDVASVAAVKASQVPATPPAPSLGSGRAAGSLAPPLAGVAPAGVAKPGDSYTGRALNNRYLVETKLGEGGFGAVYRGKQLPIGRPVAIKLLHPASARDPNLVARFRREGKVACNLRDAHTVTTYDFDQTPDGTLYIAMELLTGRSLHDVFHKEAPLNWRRVLRIVEQMCSSLGEAHEQGIVHRDLKPENVYLEKLGADPEFVKILDFGIAKIVGGELKSGTSLQLTATGQTLGTLEYMSPEQLMGKPLDGRSDIYALGVLAYEMLTGRLPFPDARGPAELIGAQLRQTPLPPGQARPDQGIPEGVDRILLCMLAKNREDRFPTVRDLSQALEVALTSGGDAPEVGVASARRASTARGRSVVAPADRAGVTELTDPGAGSLLRKPWVWAVFVLAAAGGALAAYFLLQR